MTPLLLLALALPPTVAIEWDWSGSTDLTGFEAALSPEGSEEIVSRVFIAGGNTRSADVSRLLTDLPAGRYVVRLRALAASGRHSVWATGPVVVQAEPVPPPENVRLKEGG